MANNFDFLPNHLKSTHIKKQKKRKNEQKKRKKKKETRELFKISVS